MSATILDGKSLSEQIRAEIAQETAEFTRRTGVTPCLAAVLVGTDAASEVYVRNKQKACAKAGIESRLSRLPAETTTDQLLSLVDQLNRDRAVHGILVQLPLPKGIDESRVLDAVDPLKDVDAFHPENVGRLVQGRPRFLPCTPHGIQQILSRNQIPTAGAKVVIVGRSDIVGKPMAIMLMQKGGKGDRHLLPERPGGCFAQKVPVPFSPFSPTGDATVTVCHSRTRDLAAVTRQADILIVAIGRPRFITAEMVKPGAVVIDVGMNRLETGLVGDVDFASVKEVASQITPVPGGVGLLTVAMLLHNTLRAGACSTAPLPRPPISPYNSVVWGLVRAATMKTILFVDDNEAFCRLAKLIFEEEGYQVVTAKDGQQAIEAAAAARPDVAILDIRMPKTSGFDVAEEMSELTPKRPLFSTPATTNRASPTSDRTCAACIEKSADFTELALAVSRVLSPAGRQRHYRVGLPPNPR